MGLFASSKSIERSTALAGRGETQQQAPCLGLTTQPGSGDANPDLGDPDLGEQTPAVSIVVP